MAEHLFVSVPHLAEPLRAAVDVEGKVPRAIAALVQLEGHSVVLLDGPGAPFLPMVEAAGARPQVVEAGSPLRIPAPDGTVDAVLSLWTAFRGVDPADLAEVDRVLRPGGRLLVVHDYGRDDVSLLRGPDQPEYRLWSRREGPFLRHAGFRIRVIHCFWTFASLDDARAALEAVFGEPGASVVAGLKRPRLSWNVAVYHRWRGGLPPPDGAGAPDPE